MSLACRKAKELGYPHNCGQRGFWPATLASMDPRRDIILADPRPRAQSARSSTGRGETSHKVRYYLEQRDPDFAEKMAEVLCVLSASEIFEAGRSPVLKKKLSDAMAIDFLRREARHKPSQRPPPTCRPSPAVCMRLTAWSMNINISGTIILLAGIEASGHRQGHVAGQGSPSQPRIHRIPQAS